MQILATARLSLRTVGFDDAPFYLDLLNQPSFLRYIGDKGVRTLEQARDAIRDGPMAMQAARGFSLYLVSRAQDGAALGLCGLIKRDALPDVDLGYAYLPQFAGLGYAREAAAAVVAHARDTLGLARLAAIVSPGNERSIRLLADLGFLYEKLTEVTPGDGVNLYGLDFVSGAPQ